MGVRPWPCWCQALALCIMALALVAVFDLGLKANIMSLEKLSMGIELITEHNAVHAVVQCPSVHLSVTLYSNNRAHRQIISTRL